MIRPRPIDQLSRIDFERECFRIKHVPAKAGMETGVPPVKFSKTKSQSPAGSSSTDYARLILL